MPVPLEKVEQVGVVTLFRSLGARVYVVGTKRRRGDYQGTMMSEGIPDLEVFLPARNGKPARFVKVEVKRQKIGRFSPKQIEYRGLCLAAGVDYIGGCLDDVIAWLTREGYVKAESFPHYRQPISGGGVDAGLRGDVVLPPGSRRVAILRGASRRAPRHEEGVD